MKLKMIRSILALSAALVAAAPAMAAVNIDLRYVPTTHFPTGLSPLNAFAGWLGGGAGVEVMAGSRVGFRLGGNYITRTYAANTSYGVIDTTLDVNFYPLRWLRIGVGGVMNYGLSVPAGFQTMDYAIGANLGVVVPLSAHVGLQAGAAYNYSFTQVSGSVKPHAILYHAGVVFMLGGHK